MKAAFEITYTFSFKDGSSKSFPVILDADTLDFIPAERPEPPAWTELSHHRCGECPAKGKYCPVALNLSSIIEELKDFLSYDAVGVSVKTGERVYSKDTSLQEGLSSLIGLVMATSGCPVLDPLKPMARFHLPFATVEETTFRVLSTFLVAQYIRKEKGMTYRLDLDGVKKIYSGIGRLNHDFTGRLREAAKKDAGVNALLILDSFATLVPFEVESSLASLERLFSAYLKAD